MRRQRRVLSSRRAVSALSSPYDGSRGAAHRERRHQPELCARSDRRRMGCSRTFTRDWQPTEEQGHGKASAKADALARHPKARGAFERRCEFRAVTRAVCCATRTGGGGRLRFLWEYSAPPSRRVLNRSVTSRRPSASVAATAGHAFFVLHSAKTTLAKRWEAILPISACRAHTRRGSAG